MKPQLAFPGPASGRDRRRGSSVIEFALIAPWYLFLFVGSFDMGLYSYALISVESAARVAALYCSASSATCGSWSAACPLVLDQLKDLPNAPSSCASPLSGSATYTTTGGPDGGPTITVTVNYTMPTLVGIPNLLPGSYTVIRSVEMRLRT